MPKTPLLCKKLGYTGKWKVGYILSEDPTYITNHRQARTLIRKLDRDELLQVLLRSYLSQ